MTEFINKNSKNNSELEEIFAIKDKNIMVYNLCRYLEKKSSEGKRLSALSAAERVIYIVNEFKTEAVTGCGFYDFFYEREDAHIDEAAACLRVVGANKMADICEKALITTGKTIHKSFEKPLEDIIEIIWSYDDEVRDCNEDLEKLCYKFIMKNKEKFT